ncbi:MAG: HIRAN domain-containing protein [Elainellaceae cyanobacterium]
MKTLFLAWQDPQSRAWFPIGKLTSNGSFYEFAYLHGAEKAQAACGFQPLHSFPSFNEVYQSQELFPLFANRLMRRSRPDFGNYIEWLNVPHQADDPIAILARSGGRKATDTFEVFPTPEPDENGLYHVHFFSHGLRYLPACSNERIVKLRAGEELYVMHDLQNPYDPNALLLRTEDCYTIGYLPRYLVHDACKLLDQDSQDLHVHVERINHAPTPLRFRLLCNMTTQWAKGFQPFSGDEYQPITEKPVLSTGATC